MEVRKVVHVFFTADNADYADKLERSATWDEGLHATLRWHATETEECRPGKEIPRGGSVPNEALSQGCRRVLQPEGCAPMAVGSSSQLANNVHCCSAEKTTKQKDFREKGLLEVRKVMHVFFYRG